MPVRTARSRLHVLTWLGALLFDPLPMAAQLRDVDSLHAIIAARPELDSVTAGTLYELSRSYWVRDLDSAEAVARRLLALSQRIGYERGVGDAWNSLGVVHWYRGDYPAAMEAHQRALTVRSRLGRPALVAASFHNLGLLYDDQGNYPEAIANYLKALEQYDRVGSKEGAAQEHNAIANVMVYQRQFHAALAEHRKALAIRKASNDEWGLSETYSNMGLAHAELNQLDSAEHYHGLALEIRLRTDDQQGIAVSYNNLGDLYMLRQRHHEAMESLMKALEINSRLGYRKSMASSHLNMGRLHARMGQRDESMMHLEKALMLAREVGSQDLAHSALLNLSETSARFGDHARAYAFRLQYEALTDTIYNAERTRSLVRQQMEYAFAKQQLADSLEAAEVLRQSRVSHALQLAKERNRMILIGMGGALLLVLALSLWSRLRYMRRTRDMILRTQAQLVRAEKEREAEQVRTRIARDIHDEIGGELTRIRLLGTEVRHLLDVDREAASDTVERMARSAQEATGALRDIVWATDPGRDTVKGLIDHLPDLVHRQVEGSGIRVDMQMDHDGLDLHVDPAWKSQLLRIVKEAVNNAVKYSGARSIALAFRSGPLDYELIVKDDGCGFDPELHRNGNGLRNMRARAASVNGQFSLRTAPGAGCTITVSGPLSAGIPTTQETTA